MTIEGRPIRVLMADDDQDDCLLVKNALVESGLTFELRSVSDGEALMDYLHGRNGYENTAVWPRPNLILLDLNMSLKDSAAPREPGSSLPSLIPSTIWLCL